MVNRDPKNLSRVSKSRGGGAGSNLSAFNQSIATVQCEHPEFLDRQSLGDGLEVGSHEIRLIEKRGFAFFLHENASGDFHHGNELECLDWTDALELLVVFDLPSDQTRQRAGLFDEFACE